MDSDHPNRSDVFVRTYSNYCKMSTVCAQCIRTSGKNMMTIFFLKQIKLIKRRLLKYIDLEGNHIPRDRIKGVIQPNNDRPRQQVIRFLLCNL